jgi:hypothetical protein
LTCIDRTIGFSRYRLFRSVAICISIRLGGGGGGRHFFAYRIQKEVWLFRLSFLLNFLEQVISKGTTAS